jgi:Protein tyrosine and serine/threonine kinase
MSIGPPEYRPLIPPADNADMVALQDLMKVCWNERPEDRPSFNDILKNLKRINKGELVLKCT